MCVFYCHSNCSSVFSLSGCGSHSERYFFLHYAGKPCSEHNSRESQSPPCSGEVAEPKYQVLMQGCICGWKDRCYLVWLKDSRKSSKTSQPSCMRDAHGLQPWSIWEIVLVFWFELSQPTINNGWIWAVFVVLWLCLLFIPWNHLPQVVLQTAFTYQTF